MKKFIYLLVLISGVVNGQNTVVIAHRGGSSMAPENTLAAFKTADSINADYYELDVQISLDDSLMIMHDASVDRTTNGTGNIASMTYAQLRQLDAGSWFGAAFAGEKIPTLREALLVAKNSKGNIGVVIELKSGETRLAIKTVALIQSLGLQSKVIVSCFSQWQIDQVKSIDPTIPVQRFASATNTEIDQVAAIGGEWIGSGGSFTQSVIDYAHSKGIKFNAWTINNTSQMNSLIALGVDGITTDYPIVLISILDITPPTDVVFTSVAATETDVTLTWEPAQDAFSGIAGYEIYRDVIPSATTLLATVGPVTQYIDKTNTETQPYYYRIKAKDKVGLRSIAYSNELVVTTLNDLTAPYITAVTSQGNSNTVTIWFSERIDETSAETISNYTINNGVSITAVKLSLDKKSVILTTSPLSEISYSLTVENIKDLAIIPNTIVSKSIDFQHTGIAANAVAIYTLDEIDNFKVKDGSANGNDGEVKNGVYLTAGIFGNALGFDGVDDYVSFAPSTSFNINGSEVTLSLWTKLALLPTELPTAYGPLFDSETDNYVLYEDKANNQLRFKVTTSDGAARPGIAAADLVKDQWIYVVGVYDGSEARVYLNGVKKGVLPLTGIVKPGQAATLGLSGASYFKGSIDQVEVYNIALTDQDVMSKYMTTSIVSKPSPATFKIFPNPNNGQFTLDQNSISFQNARIEVINSQGQVILKRKLDKSPNQTFTLSSPNRGIYSIRLFTEGGIHSQIMIVN